MFLDCVVEDGNPADSALACEMIDRQKVIYGRPPRQAAYDGGFASRENLKKIKAAGVKDVMLSFKSYIWGSVVSANLLILARHTME